MWDPEIIPHSSRFSLEYKHDHAFSTFVELQVCEYIIITRDEILILHEGGVT